MEPTVDNKKYATDSRSFRDAVMQDGIHKQFEDSPISARLKISDICVYKPGDLNKIGKEGKTSWDSFSYALLMGHNVWMHLESVQRANRAYDSGIVPSMLIQETFNRITVRDIVNQVFSLKDQQQSLALVDHHKTLWEQIIGTRGHTGKRATNAHTMFNNFFEVEEKDSEGDLDESRLDQLEQQ